MRVQMTFDDTTMQSGGYKRQDIEHTVKSAFAKYGLPCRCEQSTLIFEDSGREDDYAYLWKVILSLLRSPWFVACASSCTFIDDDDSEEDVLSQAWKVQRRMA